MERKKFGWTVPGIVGFVFAPIGTFFLILGILFWQNGIGRNPADPEIFLYTFCGMGALFLLSGLSFLFTDLRRRHRLRSAYYGGYCVDAAIKEIREIRSVNANGSHPVVIICSYTDSSGETHEYQSRYIYRNPGDQIINTTVPVYIDRMDERTGFVDVDALK